MAMISGIIGVGERLSALYQTSFFNTENPVSENKIWTVGDFNTGVNNATGIQSVGGNPGLCYGHNNDAVDYIGLITGRFSPTKHFSEVTFKYNNSYVAPSTQEVEVHLAGTYTGTSVRTYEMDFWFSGNVLQPVRWNGDLSFNTDVFTTVSGSWPGTARNDGDRARAYFDSSSGSPVISVYLNDVLQVVYTDTTAGKIMSGSPGLAFFARTGTGFDWTGYCAKGYKCGNW